MQTPINVVEQPNRFPFEPKTICVFKGPRIWTLEWDKDEKGWYCPELQKSNVHWNKIFKTKNQIRKYFQYKVKP